MNGPGNTSGNGAQDDRVDSPVRGAGNGPASGAGKGLVNGAVDGSGNGPVTGPDGGAATPGLRAGLPGWVLRAAIAATCGAVAAVLSAAGVESLALVLYLVLAVAAAAIPASAAAVLLIAYPAAAVVFASDGPVWPAVLALVVLLHLVHVLCAYAAVVPVRSRLHPEALKAPAKRFALVQLPVLGLAGIVILLPVGRTDAAVEVIGLACAVGLALGTVLLLRRKS